MINSKYIFSFLLISLLLFNCNYFYRHITISGSVAGVDKGDVIITDQSGEDIFGVPIKSGHFDIPTQQLKTSGYCNITIALNTRSFEIYLEPGHYDITTSLSRIDDYPEINCKSKIQNELSEYHAVADKIISQTKRKITVLTDSMTSVRMSPEKYNQVTDRLKVAQVEDKNASFKALKTYLYRYPKSIITSHILYNIDYESQLVKFYQLYQQFSEKSKNTTEGEELGRHLSALTKLQPGMMAPKLEGTTPDGKKVALKALNKRCIIVEFWRASLGSSRKNHQRFITQVLPNFSGNDVGIVSVSLDTKEDWWKTAINDDQMNWPQVSDLKGFKSPNVANWDVDIIPKYYILDGRGRILDRDLPFQNISSALRIDLDK